MNSIETTTLTTQGALHLVWHNHDQQTLPAAFLRSQCQCAPCKAHRLKGLPPAPVAPDIRITHMQPIGTYGVQLTFDDGHDRGIYPWVYLSELGQLAAHQ